MISSRQIKSRKKWNNIFWWIVLVLILIYLLYSKTQNKKIQTNKGATAYPSHTPEPEPISQQKSIDIDKQQLPRSSLQTTVVDQLVTQFAETSKSDTDGDESELATVKPTPPKHWNIPKPKVQEKTEWIFTPDMTQRHNSRDPDPRHRPLLLVAVFTTADAVAQRNGIRASWALANNSHTNYLRSRPYFYRVIFIMGHADTENLQSEIAEEAVEYGDILQLGFHDSRYEFTRKMINLLKWIQYEPQFEEKSNIRPWFLIKVLDDVYINFPALVHWLEAKYPTSSSRSRERIYTGDLVIRDRPIREATHPLFIDTKDFPEDYFPPFIRSPIYLFSWDTVLQLVIQLAKVRPLPMEDAFIGLLALKANIQPIHNEHFILIGQPDNICHHLRMFFIGGIEPMQHVVMFKRHGVARHMPECVGMLPYHEEESKQDL